MERLFTRFASAISLLSGKPETFAVAIAIIVIWAVTGPMFDFSDTWQLVVNTGTTIVTFLMVFMIQNTQNRDAAAMQAKLDELLRAVKGAREQFIGIEHLTDREVELIRLALERESEASQDGKRAPKGTVDRLLRRR